MSNENRRHRIGLRSSTGEFMRHQFGTLLQFVTLVFLPMLIIWQLTFGFQLIWMPAMLVVGIVVFSIGTKLRESK